MIKTETIFDGTRSEMGIILWPTLIFTGICDNCQEVMEVPGEVSATFRCEQDVDAYMAFTYWLFKDAECCSERDMHYCPHCATVDRKGQLLVDLTRYKKPAI